eukprot:173827-Pleurochrysis_carterae.AAC.3
MCSRSRTGGGPPSEAASDVKKRDTEKVEQGGEATTAARRLCDSPPPKSGLLSVHSEVLSPDCERKAAIPSGLIVGPEKSRKTVREHLDESVWSGGRTGGKPVARPSSGSGGSATANVGSRHGSRNAGHPNVVCAGTE